MPLQHLKGKSFPWREILLPSANSPLPRLFLRKPRLTLFLSFLHSILTAAPMETPRTSDQPQFAPAGVIAL